MTMLVAARHLHCIVWSDTDDRGDQTFEESAHLVEAQNYTVSNQIETSLIERL